jgi:hypothetical protein
MNRYLQFYKDDSGVWFRLFGYGVSVINRRKQYEPFSIRIGAVKVLRIAHWTIRPLFRNK